MLSWPTQSPSGSDEPYSINPRRAELEPVWEETFREGFNKTRSDHWASVRTICQRFSTTEHWLGLSHIPESSGDRALVLIASKMNEELVRRNDQESSRKRKRDDGSLESQRNSVEQSPPAPEISDDTDIDKLLSTSEEAQTQLKSLLDREARCQEGLRKMRKHASVVQEDFKRCERQRTNLQARLKELEDQVNELQGRNNALEADQTAGAVELTLLRGRIQTLGTDDSAKAEEIVQLRGRVEALEVDNSAKTEEACRFKEDVSQISAAHQAAINEIDFIKQDAVKDQAEIARLQTEKNEQSSKTQVLQNEVKSKDDANTALRCELYNLKEQDRKAREEETRRKRLCEQDATKLYNQAKEILDLKKSSQAMESKLRNKTTAVSRAKKDLQDEKDGRKGDTERFEMEMAELNKNHAKETARLSADKESLGQELARWKRYGESMCEASAQTPDGARGSLARKKSLVTPSSSRSVLC